MDLTPDSIRPLDPDDDCTLFRCQDYQSMENFLRYNAQGYNVKLLERVYVKDEGTGILAYITLRATELLLLRGRRQKNHPAAMICRVAVDQRHRRRSHGKDLVAFAVKTCIKVCELVAVRHIILDCTEDLFSFY